MTDTCGHCGATESNKNTYCDSRCLYSTPVIPEPVVAPPKPRLRLYPSPVPCDHCVLVTPPNVAGYRLAYWHYKGVQRVKSWLISADESLDSIKRHMRNHQPCDIFIIQPREQDQ